MIQTYNNIFGFDGRTTENPDEYANWTTDKVQATINLSKNSSGNEVVILVFHSFEYDLNS